MKLIQERDNLFRITLFGLVNCYLLREDDGLTLIDAGLPGTGAFIRATAEKAKSPIRRIVLTHAHFDHIGSLDILTTADPEVELCVGTREARLLAKDLSLDKGEHGKALFGFSGARSRPTRLLEDEDRIGSLKVISCPGHTPGHMAFLDVRDNSLLAGDAFTTQTGLVVAGVFRPTFPFPALFSWNAVLSAKSAIRLRGENPAILATGHGKPLPKPSQELDRAIEEALRQHPETE